jgi:hypothetical protein
LIASTSSVTPMPSTSVTAARSLATAAGPQRGLSIVSIREPLAALGVVFV